MNFECFMCGEKFASENTAINHLQKHHEIKDQSTELKCLVNFGFCKKSYLTYSGLRKHLKSCSKKQYGDSSSFSEVISRNNSDFPLHLYVYLSMNKDEFDKCPFPNRLRRLELHTRRRRTLTIVLSALRRYITRNVTKFVSDCGLNVFRRPLMMIFE